MYILVGLRLHILFVDRVLAVNVYLPNQKCKKRVKGDRAERHDF